jgi:hypothetical protein
LVDPSIRSDSSRAGPLGCQIDALRGGAAPQTASRGRRRAGIGRNRLGGRGIFTAAAGRFRPSQATGGGGRCGAGPERDGRATAGQSPVAPGRIWPGFGRRRGGPGWSRDGWSARVWLVFGLHHLPGDVYLHHQPHILGHDVKILGLFFGLHHLLEPVFWPKVMYMTVFLHIHHLLEMLLVLLVVRHINCSQSCKILPIDATYLYLIIKH